MIDNYVNRSKEREVLSELLQPSTNNKVITIYSNSGFGKSEFAKKIAEDYPSLNILRIEFQDTDNTDGFYIKKIAEAIDMKKNLLTLHDYIKNDKKLVNHDSEVLNRLIEVNYFKAFKSLKHIYDRKTSSGEYNNRFYLENSEKQILLLTDYIETAFKDKRIILNIDNIQSIDQSSYEQLKILIERCSYISYFLEYTLNSSHRKYKKEAFQNLSNSLDKDELIEFTKLELLEFLKNILTKEQIEGMKLYLDNSYYKEYNGNLRNLKDQIVTSLDGLENLIKNSNNNLDGTKSRLNTLSRDEKFMLSLISAHKGQVSIEYLTEVFYEAKEKEITFNFDIYSSINKLISEPNPLIKKEENDIVEIKHDDVSRAIDEIFLIDLLQAYNLWGNFYEMFYKNQNYDDFSKKELLSNLFFFYSHSKQEKLFNIISELKKYIVQSKYPLQSIKYLYKLQKVPIYNKKQIDKINYYLIDIFYYLGQFEDCLKILKKIDEKSIKWKTYKVAIYNRLDKHPQALNLIDEILENDVHSNLSFQLTLLMIKMISKRSLNQLNDSIKIFNKIQKNESFHNLYEYGFLLRNSDIVKGFRESIPYIEKSITFFEERQELDYKGHSLISLGMQYTRLGNLKEAKEVLTEAQELLFDYSLEKHIIFINLAVIAIFENQEYTYIMSLLNEAKKDSTTSFAQLALYNNMFVFLVRNSKFNEANEIQSKIIELLSNQPDKAMHRTIYYNISQYFKYILKNDEYHQKFLTKAIETFEKHDNYWEYRLFNKELVDKNFDFLAKFDYHLVLMSYWHFDLSKIDTHH